jgi:uncharacterized phage infection (PIP) family protein YhgE
MPIDTMTAKIQIAKALQEQSALVFDFRLRNFPQLSIQQRLELKGASRKLNSRADEVLEDALEEGAKDAETLLAKLDHQTESLKLATDQLGKVNEVLGIAAKVIKAAAGVISGGIPTALGLL